MERGLGGTLSDYIHKVGVLFETESKQKSS